MYQGHRTFFIKQTCSRLGVSRRTVHNWMAEGKVKYVHTAGGSVRIFEDTLYRDGETGKSSETIMDQVRDRSLVSVNVAMKIVGVSRRTIYNWLAAGKIEYVRTAGGSVRIFEDTLYREANTKPKATTVVEQQPVTA